MAYDYLDEKSLADALHDSEEYMRSFHSHIPELQRITRAKPGKVPAGKPRVTDGTLAAIRREIPKQIIQQLPSGRVIIHGNEDMEDYAQAILTDVLLPNANAGGTPFAKSKKAIRNTVDVGSAWAECFFNRRGDLFYADYRIKYYADVLFEKGKVSEFDTNFMPVIDWMTEGDVKATIYYESQRQYTETEWDLKALQELLDKGPSTKDEQNKTPEEKKADNNNNGFFKLVKFYQIGVGATFYYFAPTINKVVYKCVNKDPRGIMPLHGLVPEDDDDNPLGEPLARYSAGKQNLLDFDMQMYQYGQGLGYSPTVKKWGNTPAHKIKIAPDNVIELDGNPSTDDFQVVNIGNSATANFANNYGLIKSQILNETGRTGDTSVPASSGNPGFSKTPAGVKAGEQRLSVSDNDLRVSYELWQGRIYETLLNIHFAYSEGTKQVELESDTLKRLKLDKAPTINYDKDYGKIKLTVNASTSRKLSDEEMVANMEQVEPQMTIVNAWQLAQKGWKLDIGEFQKQKLNRMNIDSMDKILTKMDDKEAAEAKKQPFPIIDAPQFRMNSADMSQEQINAILSQQGGVTVQPGADPHIDLVDIINDPTTPASVKAQIQQRAGLQPDLEVQQALQIAETHSKSAPAAAPDKGRPLGETMQWKPGDLTASERAQALQQIGITPDPEGNPSPNAIAQATDTATRIDQHSQDSAITKSNHVDSKVEEPEAVDNPQEEQLDQATAPPVAAKPARKKKAAINA